MSGFRLNMWGPKGLTDGIVKTQGGVPVPPLVTHSRLFLDNEVRNPKVLESSGEIKARLTTTDDKHFWFTVCEFSLPSTLIKPFAMVGSEVP